MATQLQIVNQALAHVGEPPISAATFTAHTVKASVVATNAWDFALKSTLRMHPWNFASKRASLVPITEPSTTVKVTIAADATAVQMAAAESLDPETVWVAGIYIDITLDSGLKYRTQVGTVSENAGAGHTLNFATGYKMPSAATANNAIAQVTFPGGYTYAYAMPSDCVRVLEVVGEDRQDNKWRMEKNHVVTNMTSPLEIRYISDTTLVADFDDLFTDALAAKLGMDICESLVRQDGVLANVTKILEEKLNEARSIDGMEQTVEEAATADYSWMVARY